MICFDKLLAKTPRVIYLPLRSGIVVPFPRPSDEELAAAIASFPLWMPQAGDPQKVNSTVSIGRFLTGEYTTQDFERFVALKVRTEAIARNLSEFLKRTDRFAKTFVFCVGQEYAEEMRKALDNLNADLVQQHADYVARVVSDEAKIGRGHLDRFIELEPTVPALVTTSQMLATGVDGPTCKNVVLVRVINSMKEFKQIIGRGDVSSRRLRQAPFQHPQSQI